MQKLIEEILELKLWIKCLTIIKLYELGYLEETNNSEVISQCIRELKLGNED